MADPEKKDEEAEAAPPAKAQSGLVAKLVNAAGIFVLCLAAVVVGQLISSKFLTYPTEYRLDKDGMIRPVLPPPSAPDKREAAEENPSGKPPAPAIYLKMDPQMVVNFDATSEVKFLALDIEFMARDQAVIDDVQRNMPMIRNNILMLISNRDYKTLMTREGKDKLRLEALDEARKVLKQETGSAKLEDLLFTSFVVQ